MFKKQIAIITLVIFFLSQFGKVINYSFCKMAVYQQTGSFVCDCEKLLYTIVTADHISKQQAPANIGTHQLTEELFHFHDMVFTAGIRTFSLSEWPVHNSNKHSILFLTGIFRPPVQLA